MTTLSKNKLPSQIVFAAVICFGMLSAFSVVAFARTTSMENNWKQSNVSGFGNPQNIWINSLTTYDGHIFAGVQGNPNGGQTWRSADGSSWDAVNTDGFGDVNTYPEVFIVFSNTLYLGTRNNILGAGIYTTTDGITWTNVISGGFGITNNKTIMNMSVFDGYLYAATVDDVNSSIGGQIWRTSDGLTWTNVVTNNFGLGATHPNIWWAFEVFEGQLYAGTGGYTGSGLLYRTNDGINWLPVTIDGFGDSNNLAIPCLAVFNDYLYACTRSTSDIGAQVWRSRTGDPGTWVKVATGGLGNPNYNRPNGLIVANNTLYLTLTVKQSLIGADGDQVWSTNDGLTWVPEISNGWGDANNSFSDYSDKGATVFKNSLYIGMNNPNTGGQIWRRLQLLYLPFISPK